MTLTDMKIELCANGYMFTAKTDECLSTVCVEKDECFTDKSDVRKILLSVIENFNKVNPHYKIEVVE